MCVCVAGDEEREREREAASSHGWPGGNRESGWANMASTRLWQRSAGFSTHGAFVRQSFVTKQEREPAASVADAGGLKYLSSSFMVCGLNPCGCGAMFAHAALRQPRWGGDNSNVDLLAADLQTSSA